MRKVKDTARARVMMSGCGTFEKSFRHNHALQRFWNEVHVLQHLERVGCPFVPRLLDYSVTQLSIVTSNVGQAVQNLPRAKIVDLFAQLEFYGVRHDDPELRNITYDPRLAQFCVIDFEFATILSEASSTAEASALRELERADSLLAELK